MTINTIYKHLELKYQEALANKQKAKQENDTYNIQYFEGVRVGLSKSLDLVVRGFK